MIEDYLIVELSLYIIVKAEGLLAEPSAAAEAFEAGDLPMGQGLVAAGDVVPAPVGRWLAVIFTIAMWTKWGDKHLWTSSKVKCGYTLIEGVILICASIPHGLNH